MTTHTDPPSPDPNEPPPGPPVEFRVLVPRTKLTARDITARRLCPLCERDVAAFWALCPHCGARLV